MFGRTKGLYVSLIQKNTLTGPLNRLEVMDMLKELVDSDLVEPSYISMVQIEPDHFQIQIKCDYNKQQIETHAKKHGSTITEDEERKYLVIFKP